MTMPATIWIILDPPTNEVWTNNGWASPIGQKVLLFESEEEAREQLRHLSRGEVVCYELEKTDATQ